MRTNQASDGAVSRVFASATPRTNQKREQVMSEQVDSMTHAFAPATVTIQRADGTSEALSPGCWIDGHRGQYGARRVVEIADDLLGTDFGADWPVDDDGSELGSCGATGSPWAGVMGDDTAEDIVDRSDRAESALNAATSSGYWEWCDGEFFLIARCAACDEIEEDHENGEDY